MVEERTQYPISDPAQEANIDHVVYWNKETPKGRDGIESPDLFTASSSLRKSVQEALREVHVLENIRKHSGQIRYQSL
jgi:hypothetical protein